ncbi:major facilitator superfamily MFS-1 [Sparassis crispa]|uniref:Major facilitator superfamily MFS-1 n=1 Tax=Sparassis crispa TaxID=139825 RepID=A0A401GG63_9APHY|nr:major facilitator superfamily MFS-1 [Sparassis crispa]GBE81176.1 major facilitator superfamily MFS-1 [Sparassis crispa]
MSNGLPENVSITAGQPLGMRDDASGVDASLLPVVGGPHQDLDAERRPGRVLFANTIRKNSSLVGRWREMLDEEVCTPPPSTPAQPPIPSALQQPGEEYAAPLPVLSMLVLSITMLGEFLSANVSAPWILFMVQGFNQFSDESRTGYSTGILVSTFFLTQFLTSLLWVTIAARYGQRFVLFISLFGTAVTCFLFGISSSLQQAMAIRLMQGVFAGAIGVARGCVTTITDQSNEGRAYAILGFCWGMGGVAGAVIGGIFESPAAKWPSVFGRIPLFVKYPYLLPCGVAASVTFTGSIMCLFLGPDGGPRERANLVSLEKTASIEEREVTSATSLLDGPSRHAHYGSVRGSFRISLRGRPSGYFPRHISDMQERPTSPLLFQNEPASVLSTPSRISRYQPLPQTSGLAYEYSGTYRSRPGSSSTRRLSRAILFSRRRDVEGVQSSMDARSERSFTHRLVMANENAVNNLADLWVAAAMSVDGEDAFESQSEVDTDTDDDEDDEGPEELVQIVGGNGGDVSGTIPSVPANRSNRFYRTRSLPVSNPQMKQMYDGRYPRTRGSLSRSKSRFPAIRRRSSTYSLLPSATDLASRRLPGAASIFAHAGVRPPPAVLEVQQPLPPMDEPLAPLPPILESQRVENVAEEPKEPSLLSQLPVLVIIQYGLLALHTTTHDQVFYLYLVSKYPLGGLNLDAGHFSQLIALMCLAQIAYQFYLYPNIGPPRGRFSHLAVFRIGSLLFIPSYLSVVLYRPMAGPTGDADPVLMSALALSTAIRYCGATFTFTSVAVLLNYMSPPHMVGYANGVAQSIVSLARFIGPILGGTLWSMSVENGPSGYALGFIACASVCALAVTHSLLIR